MDFETPGRGTPMYRSGTTLCWELRSADVILIWPEISTRCYRRLSSLIQLWWNIKCALPLTDLHSILHRWSQETGCWLGGRILDEVLGAPLVIWPFQVSILASNYFCPSITHCIYGSVPHLCFFPLCSVSDWSCLLNWSVWWWSTVEVWS